MAEVPGSIITGGNFSNIFYFAILCAFNAKRANFEQLKNLCSATYLNIFVCFSFSLLLQQSRIVIQTETVVICSIDGIFRCFNHQLW